MTEMELFLNLKEVFVLHLLVNLFKEFYVTGGFHRLVCSSALWPIFLAERMQFYASCVRLFYLLIVGFINIYMNDLSF